MTKHTARIILTGRLTNEEHSDNYSLYSDYITQMADGADLWVGVVKEVGWKGRHPQCEGEAETHPCQHLSPFSKPKSLQIYRNFQFLAITNTYNSYCMCVLREVCLIIWTFFLAFLTLIPSFISFLLISDTLIVLRCFSQTQSSCL